MKLTFEGTPIEFAELVDSVICDGEFVFDEVTDAQTGEKYCNDSVPTLKIAVDAEIIKITGRIVQKSRENDLLLIFVQREPNEIPLAIDCSDFDYFDELQIGDTVRLDVSIIPKKESRYCYLHLENCR